MDISLKSEIEMLNDQKMWETNGPRRSIFEPLREDFRSGMMAMVFGLRRTGKTYLVQQILAGQERAFYFSFDKLSFQKQAVLEEVIRHALSQGYGAIALDEIQKVPGWTGILKSYYDHFKPKPRFLLSGSSAIHLRKGSESLAGRVYEHPLAPLSYSEFLEFSKISPAFRQDWVEEYLRAGAFPEAVLKKMDPGRYARSVADKIVGEDVPQAHALDHPEHLPDIIRLLAERTGRPVDWRDIGASIGITKDTAQRYARMLEASFLFDIVRMRGRFGATVGKNKKVYFAHPSIAAAYADLPIGFAAETAVYAHLKMLGTVGFFRNGNEEVDFTLDAGRTHLPVEVKYQNSITPSDLRPISRYMEKRGTDGVLITRNREETLEAGRHTLYLVPLHEFLFKPACILPGRAKGGKNG